jgi:hypothetical protein
MERMVEIAVGEAAVIEAVVEAVIEVEVEVEVGEEPVVVVEVATSLGHIRWKTTIRPPRIWVLLR